VVAAFAIHVSFVFRHCCGIQCLAASLAVEALLVPWGSDSDGALRVIHGDAAARTLGAGGRGGRRLARHALGLVVHLALLVAEALPLVHAECAGAAAEPVTLGSVLAAMALLAEQDQLVVGHGGGVQHLVAHGALEAELVILVAVAHFLLGGVHRLAAHRALVQLWGLERHGGWLAWTFRKMN